MELQNLTDTHRCDTLPTPTPEKVTAVVHANSMLSSDQSGKSSSKRQRQKLPSRPPPLIEEDPGDGAAMPVPNHAGALIRQTCSNPASSSNKTYSISSDGSTLPDFSIFIKGGQPQRSMIKEQDDVAEKLVGRLYWSLPLPPSVTTNEPCFPPRPPTALPKHHRGTPRFQRGPSTAAAVGTCPSLVLPVVTKAIESYRGVAYVKRAVLQRCWRDGPP
jgi:hypothetical protein